ncbi:Proteasome activator BLM10 [Savitreella phatthalungensis]
MAVWSHDGQTFPYFSCLPYTTETQEERLARLSIVVDALEHALASEDWPRALYWNTELRDWLSLKFRMPQELRIRLIRIYYELITAFGIDSRPHARFMTTFLTLTKRRDIDIELDWRRLWLVIKRILVPSGELIIRAVDAEDLYHLKTLIHAQGYFPLSATEEMLTEFLPLFQTSDLDDAFLCLYLVCGFLPTKSYAHVDRVMPTIFHLWNLLGSSHVADAVIIEFLSRWSRDAFLSGQRGNLLTDTQLDYLFTHLLRLMKIPVGNSTGGSHKSTDAYAKSIFFNRKYTTAKDVARLLVYMLPDDRVYARLQTFIDATENFFHPSNSGAWITPLASVLYELVTFYQLRKNREESGEYQSPENIGPGDRLVDILLKVTFMATYNRSGDVQNLAQAALQGLAMLAPDKVIPGALKRIYPSLQGLVEAHRTAVSLHDLGNLTSVLVVHPRWRTHLTTLVTLALPGIDANDLGKTSMTLMFLTQVAHAVSIEDVSTDGDISRAQQVVERDLQLLEEDATDFGPGDLEDTRSSTAAWRDIVSMLLDRIFILLQNLPPTTSSSSGESQAQNELICAMTPICVALSDELFDLACRKVVDFCQGHTLYNVADTMSGVVNALCKARPHKTWHAFFGPLTASIRSEVLDNHAGSTRSGGADILPRDRGLVWYIRCLEGLVDAGGPELIAHRKELRELVSFLMGNCVSQATEFIGILVSSYLEGLVETYPTDHRRLVAEEVGGAVTGIESWGRLTPANALRITWHRASDEELAEATEFFISTASDVIAGIDEAIETSRASAGKVRQEWSDVIVSRLSYLENLLAGATELFESSRAFRSDEEVSLDNLQYTSVYPYGRRVPERARLDAFRDSIGLSLHKWHNYLTAHHADDVLCFDVLLLVFKTWFGNVGYQRADGSQSKLTNIYVEDIAQFKVPGRRKAYPRPYLVRRALLYHVQRTKHATLTVDVTPTHRLLLEDLQQTSIGAYTEIRAIAQSALNMALRSVADVRSSVIPFFLDALDSSDQEIVKGALYTLSGKGIKSFIGRSEYFPRLLRKLVLLSNADKPSMMLPVKQAYLECALKSRPPPPVCVYEKDELSVKSDIVGRDSERQAALRADLVELARSADWRIAGAAMSSLGASVSSLGLPLSSEVATLTFSMAISDHPALRTIAGAQINHFLGLCWLRVLAGGDLTRAATEELLVPGRQIVSASEADGQLRDTRVGWLVWPDEVEIFKPGPSPEVDAETAKIFADLGPTVSLDWFVRLVGFWREEPKEGHGKFRTHVAHFLRLFFVCTRRMTGAVTLEQARPLITELCGRDQPHFHQRVGAEMLAGAMGSLRYESEEYAAETMSWCTELLKDVLHTGLTPENLSYWQSCVTTTLRHRDARRFANLVPLLLTLADLDDTSAFAASARLSVLRKAIGAIGWRFVGGDLASQLARHLAHPYKRVRDEIGKTLSLLWASRPRGYKNVPDLLDACAGKDFGVAAYPPSPALRECMQATFSQLAIWRSERPPGAEQPTAYTTGCKTTLAWLSCGIDSTEVHQLLPFVPTLILPELLHMLDVKEDHDLLVLAVNLFKALSNAVYPPEQVHPMSQSLVEIMTTHKQWHHRLRVMAILQVFYYRNVFYIGVADRQAILDAVVLLLSDAQLEVREGAASTLSGMIRASSTQRDETIDRLIRLFQSQLDRAPVSRSQQAILARHAPILGLSALVSAFPYDSPPLWLPEVLARLARSADNPHPIGASIKRVLASFKKTHNDTWHIDQKAFTQEQLDDLAEPSHTYFA